MVMYRHGGGPDDYARHPEELTLLGEVELRVADPATGVTITNLLTAGGSPTSAVSTAPDGTFEFFAPLPVVDIGVPYGGGERLWRVVSKDALLTALTTDPETLGTLVPWTAVGSPDGVAPLDGAGIVPPQHVGGLSPVNFGAAPELHTHGLADLPDAARLLGAAVVVVRYDETAEQWASTRAALGLQPGQLVFWFGDAEPPADADPDDLHGFDAAAVPLPPVDPPDPPSEARDENGVVLNEPTINVTEQTANVTALLNTDTALTFRYLQFAIRRDGDATSNYDAGHTQNLVVDGDYTLTASRSALPAGDYLARLAYSLDGTVWKDGPSTAFEITAAPTAPAAVALLGRSGLPWNAGVFFQNGSRTGADAFAAWRNRPLDSIMYFTGRATWEDLLWLRDDLTSWPGYRVICVPFQPTNVGMNNTHTAAGTNNSRWVTFGNALKAKGWDDGRTIVRLSWECNGNWYPWAWGHTGNYPTAGGAISAFTGAWINVVNSVRSVAPKTLFDCNANRGNQRSGVNFFTDILDPLADYLDIVGLDWYSHAPAQLTQSEFDSTAAQTYSGNDLHAWCVTNGKLLSLDEWFPSHGAPSVGVGGGDDPNWIARMWTWMQGKAYGNGGRLIQEISYNDPGAPSALMHAMYQPEQNPNAAAAYRSTSRWGRA